MHCIDNLQEMRLLRFCPLVHRLSAANQSVRSRCNVRDALLVLADSLESDPDSVENAAYEAAKTSQVQPPLCSYMYQILLGSASAAFGSVHGRYWSCKGGR